MGKRLGGRIGPPGIHIERGIDQGFAKTNELLARVVELLEESNAGGSAAPTNGKSGSVAKR